MSAPINENDLETFDGWLRYQAIDALALSPHELETWLAIFDETERMRAATPKVGLMNLQRPGLLLYAVAVRDSELWLTMWVKRTADQLFILLPGRGKSWDAHASYHRNGHFHHKSYGRKSMPSRRQPLDVNFRGTEHLGAFGGHFPKSIGAICEPSHFTGIVDVPVGVLGPRSGMVIVDLVQPGYDPLEWPGEIVRQSVFYEMTPHLVIRIVR